MFLHSSLIVKAMFYMVSYETSDGMAGKAGATQPLECSEARLRPGGSCGGPGHCPCCPGWKAPGWDVTPGHTGTPGHRTQNTEHGHTSTGTSGHGSTGQRHTQSQLDTQTPWWPHTDHRGHRGHGVRGTGKGPFGTTALEL